MLVFGGSLGARTINEAALAGLDGASFRVLHVTGTRDWPALRERPRGPRYDLREYLDRDAFARALAACDLVVGRSGGSIFEIASYGRPAILVPYPHAAAGHQRSNAQWMARGGCGDHRSTTPSSAGRGWRRRSGGSSATRHGWTAMARASLALARPRGRRGGRRDDPGGGLMASAGAGGDCTSSASAARA